MASKPVLPPRIYVSLHAHNVEQGTRIKDYFKWPTSRDDDALWTYLTNKAGPTKDWAQIAFYQSDKLIKTYTLITKGDSKALQRYMASATGPFYIYVTMKPGVAPRKEAPAPAKAYAQSPAPKAYAAADYPAAEELRDLLEELRQVINTHDRSHPRSRY